MRAILIKGDELVVGEHPDPAPSAGEVRIRVHATAVNRADLIQRAGHYAPPAGASPILGLECAGVIDEIGPEVSDWRVGDRVCALLSGGGYAERVVAPTGHLLPIPTGMDFATAAALPEACCTVHDALFVQAELARGERVVIHAGASGIGTTAIQLCREWGCQVFVTAGSSAKIDRCIALGAQAGAVRHDGPWAQHPWLDDGVDVVLDPVGGAYLDDNLKILKKRGRLVLIGLLGGRRAEADLGRILVKRLRLIGTVLRSRSDAEKERVVRRVRQMVWPLVEQGAVQPVIHSRLAWVDAGAAHGLVRSNETAGKVVLTFDEGSRQFATVD